MIHPAKTLFVMLGITLGADLSLAQTAPPPSPPSPPPPAMDLTLKPAEAMVMLDHQVISVPGIPSIDLMGFHVLNKMNDWLYLGIGGYAPLFKGEYGGFMAVDVTAHAQRKIAGDLFVDAGVSLGGGGGGKSIQQSKILSGTGGFIKTYVGLGYDFKDFSVGANLSKMRFRKSAINDSQLNVYVQVPFTYDIASYDAAGARGRFGDAGEGSENMLSLGLDNYRQRSPQGANKDTIHVADLQFSHFMSKDSYWFASAAVGYRGLPLYNQVLGGVGYRVALSPSLKLYGQVGVGSGGYAPETIDTGPGLLVYPKATAELMLNKNLGLALTAGYLFAPRGSSKNLTFGAALNYHLQSGTGGSAGGSAGGGAGDSAVLRGYRFNVFQQTETSVRFRGQDRGNINLLTLQADGVINDHLYLPVQTSVAYNAYLDYPGYGELLAGLGVQTRHDKASRFQVFGQLLVGTNVHGPMLKTGVGLNVGLSERLALYGVVGQSIGVDKVKKFRANHAGIGLTYRFALPSL